ncbi:putative ribosome biosynthesis protein GDT1 [Kluyveromyces lactis]|uniref:GDT1 family protein n=1 Tax=Kluyveromyces lactis (strain ATCC 8585 / CBS 2359 / DSM 70799 / NBRC 1267 / NRRL Y-1140 / WM37) TaxID=284590 RepID=Q6CM15_KLULA|nr:uncharacterized protein KLLA0_E23761g [Kluyveromyces lactis]CAH00111.1 KLLA0E23761p [Kluyveromyces lactis]|eukprot:XP_455024.1 uncharacterized protein KLLA0_E23761g [Kluyveromyces lactis]
MRSSVRTILSFALFLCAVTAIEPVDENNQDYGSSEEPVTAFLLAISMIGVSEIGDKTFLIAALMAMRHDRLLVFSASTASLVIMTILGGLIGRTFTTLIPYKYTLFAAGILFLVFGYKLVLEGLEMPKNAGIEEELAEVEEEIAIQDINHTLHESEEGTVKDSNKYAKEKTNGVFTKFKDFTSRYISGTWIQIFTMVFLGEFGDRSQISTIAMASGSNFTYVMLGACIGHAICTGVAVIGGKLLASKISMRTVTLGGALSFFIFGFLYVYEAFLN